MLPVCMGPGVTESNFCNSPLTVQPQGKESADMVRLYTLLYFLMTLFLKHLGSLAGIFPIYYQKSSVF